MQPKISRLRRFQARLAKVQGSKLMLKLPGKVMVVGILNLKVLSLLLPPPSSCASGSLDLLASVCGFSLGVDEATRIVNISLIQAKEEALLALQNVKQKIAPVDQSSAKKSQDNTIEAESSSIKHDDKLELVQLGAESVCDLSNGNQDEDPILEC